MMSINSNNILSNMEPKEMPVFSSTIPTHLLDGADPARRYIMEQLDINSKQMDWLARETFYQSRTLDRVESLAKATNGRVTTLERKELDHSKITQENSELLKTHDTAIKPLKMAYSILSNKTILKYGAIFCFIFLYGTTILYQNYHEEAVVFLKGLFSK